MLGVSKQLDASRQDVVRLTDQVKRVERVKDKIAADALELSRTITTLKREIKGLELQLNESEKTVGKLRKRTGQGTLKYKLLAEDERYYRLSYGDANRMIEKQTDQLTLLNNYVLQLKTHNTELEDQRKKFLDHLKDFAYQLSSTKESWKKEANNNKELSKTILKKDDEIQNLRRRSPVRSNRSKP
ncbi:uncharacterized protein CEXT_137371 [Caerostris extrusa]|uniref:Uncharacterized protein n=1 Tax=Caerostris extrusa TaxID=172846 RepID=A0AAV4WFT6_CAEEX|nr:uncharacterized protein CEXT_137371 [Caerostris extrusa]